MLYKLIMISYILLFAISCTGSPLSTKEKPDYALGWNYIFWAIIKPEQDRQASCARQDAVTYCEKCNCVYNKVSEGLLFDATTNLPIKVETLSPGQSFYCQCGSTYTSNTWYRGNKIEDNPQPGISINEILNTSPRNGNPANRNLIYKTHYNQPDNLYCLVQCPIGQYDLQYQFLKIR
jgi:hypothetical protein